MSEGFINNFFLVSKEGRWNKPVMNFKDLNEFKPYQHFKMKVLSCLRNVLKKRYYTCKLDLKDAYFSIPLNPSSTKFV